MQDKKLKICQICGLDIKDNTHFYKIHKLTIKQYFEQEFPRKNLLTGQPLPFKDLESYFERDFEDKLQLSKYLEESSLKKKIKYCEELLIKRKERKNLKYAPCQVELKSLIAPTVAYYDKIFEIGYYNLCHLLGFINKFKSFESFSELKNSAKILIDTREQTPIEFESRENEIATLPFGDYSLINSKLFIERKSFADFVSSFGKGVDRLNREFLNAQTQGLKIIVLIEENISKALTFDKINHLKRFTKATPSFIFHNVREICQAFDNVQFIFADGRKEVTRLIPKLLDNPQLFDYDLELLYEKMQL